MEEKQKKQSPEIEAEAQPIDKIKQTRSFGFLLSFAALMVLSFMVAVDASALSNVLPIISLSLDMTAIETFWTGTSFLLASSIFQLCVASFSEVLGRKSMMYTTLVLFFVGSVVGIYCNDVVLWQYHRSIIW